ncbi:hypothetical protein L484_003628 [Morus notabilis]|uniref:Uncharacterized protein n=1 Tax=Morus notabilis TaxID=981085 RepID=W9R3B8_9ROSA|nr:hypothetical protein L484_003628 [Morus notabilis]
MEPDLAGINRDLTLPESTVTVSSNRTPANFVLARREPLRFGRNEPNRVEERRNAREKARIDRPKNGSGRDGDGSSRGRDGDGISRVCLFDSNSGTRWRK